MYNYAITGLHIQLICPDGLASFFFNDAFDG